MPRVNREHGSITRGNGLRLQKARVTYDLRKYYFTNRAVNILNSLPRKNEIGRLDPNETD